MVSQDDIKRAFKILREGGIDFSILNSQWSNAEISSRMARILTECEDAKYKVIGKNSWNNEKVEMFDCSSFVIGGGLDELTISHPTKKVHVYDINMSVSEDKSIIILRPQTDLEKQRPLHLYHYEGQYAPIHKKMADELNDLYLENNKLKQQLDDIIRSQIHKKEG